jgi:hypothetical protein
VEFLIRPDDGCLGLNIDQTHVISLLNLLVQEESIVPRGAQEEEEEKTMFILFDEFIELVKTFMKKEQILVQS